MINIKISPPAKAETILVLVDEQPIGGIQSIFIDSTRVQMSFSSAPYADELYDLYSPLLKKEGVQVLRTPH